MKRKNSLQDYEKLGKLLHNISNIELVEFNETVLMFQSSKECQLFYKAQKYLNKLKSEMDNRVCRDYPKFEYATKVFYRNNIPMDYQEKMEKESQKDK